MSLKSQIAALFQSKIESSNVRYVTQPAAAAGTALVSDGVVAAWAWAPYIQVCAAAVITNPSWLVGIGISTGAVEIWYGDIAVATGAAAAEVDIAHIPVATIHVPTAVGVGVAVPCFLPYPIKIIGSPRLAIRLRKSTAASAAGCAVKLILATAVGT